MGALRAVGVCVVWLGVAVASLSVDAALHHPPRSRPSLSRCAVPPVRGALIGAVAEGPSKPSSYAPQPRARSRSYGAPIQRPIVTKHRKHKTRAGSHRGSSAAADRRSG